MCVTRRGDPTKNHRGRNQRKVSDDGPDEQPGPEMSDVGWTVTYAQHGDHRTATFASLDIAVGFAVDGNQDGTHHVSRITCPDGSVLEGAELRELRLRYELGEWYV